MDEKATKLLEAFAEVCRRQEGPPRPEHWQHLYDFTLYVHRRGLHPTARTVRDYLVAHGCSVQKANWVGGEYKRFAELLALYDQQRSTDLVHKPKSL
jgi:hypothetical protein